MMEYKGYFAKVEFDDEVDIFHGEIINLRDVVPRHSLASGLTRS
jgi:predicted HicB family RNase H-like nuclease